MNKESSPQPRPNCGDVPEWVFEPIRSSHALTTSQRLTREAFWKAGYYELPPEMLELSALIVQRAGVLRGAMDELAGLFERFQCFTEERGSVIPDESEGSLAWYRRPEVDRPSMMLYALSDAINPEYLGTNA